MVNVYEDILKSNEEKLLNLYNMDPFSASFGYGDRLSWGWKISDFNNGTLQGGVHTLAVIVKNKLSRFDKDKFINCIKNIILATDQIRAKNGSMIEAYPGESSFCVTALVAFDFLSTIDILADDLEEDFRQLAFEIIKPMIDFITKNDEEHAIISNHLATGVAAITKWNKLTNDNNERHLSLLEIIYKHQSIEGWYKEYEGADPGYQTLCTYYLAAAYIDWKDPKLKLSLKNSAAFLKHFVHVDGTIGGLYGSRNTEVYYPGGIIALAEHIEDFGSIAKAMQIGIEEGNNLKPENIDPGNYIPFLNSYAFAALHFDQNQKALEEAEALQFSGEITYEETGIFIKHTSAYQAIVNFKKGGTVKVFDKSTGKIDIEDGGYFAALKNGKKVSTQMMTEQPIGKKQVITTFFYINESQPSPLTTIILRSLALTVFKSLFLGNLFKKMIVGMLMTGKQSAGGELMRSFNFEEEYIMISDKVSPPSGTVKVEKNNRSKAIHMASSGYFIPQTWEAPEEPKIVRFQ